jgi:hypothetical protein
VPAVWLLALVGGLSAAPASASAPIEGVWSFNGGEVAIAPQGDGTLTGTVVAPTKFAQCVHPVGEHVWTSIVPQSDHSYWGDHQWYFATEECVPNPTLGLTAWRVLEGPEGARFLRVCLSEPGNLSQPTIDASGTVSGDTYGCQDSARVSSLPGSPALSLPQTSGKCLAARRLRLRLRAAHGDPFESVSVTLRSGAVRRPAKLRTVGDVVKAQLDLTGLPQLTFTVTIRTSTVLGRKLRRKHTYNVCSLPRRSPKHHHR